jgi:hypothetical protein
MRKTSSDNHDNKDMKEMREQSSGYLRRRMAIQTVSDLQ